MKPCSYHQKTTALVTSIVPTDRRPSNVFATRAAVDVCRLRDDVVGSYTGYVRSFVTISHETSKTTFVDQRLDEGHLWPESLVRLTPAFRPG
jgi:hypothetical protein